MSGRTYSVIIATYRRPALVLQCVESVLAQTLPALEIIVVNDGSEDETTAVIEERYPSVTVIDQPNLGRSLARNRGAAAAVGDFVCFVDDDDAWHPDKLEVVDRYLSSHPGCVAVNHPIWFFTPSDHPVQHAYGFEVDFVADTYQECLERVAGGDPSRNDWSYLDIRGSSYELLLERNRGALSASVIERRTFHTAGGFVTALPAADDWVLFLSVARIAEWHTIPRRLVFCRQHAGQGTNEIDNTLAILTAYNLVWFGGRALPQHVSVGERADALDRYRHAYRDMAQHFVWAAVKARRWDLARASWSMSRPLLRRGTDRASTALPARVTTWLRRRT